MRIFSAPNVVEHADQIVRVILETDLARNKTVADVRESLDDQELNPLREFGSACRDDLRR